MVSCACRQHCRDCILLFFEPSPLVPLSAVRLNLWLEKVFLKRGVGLGLGFRTLSTWGFPRHQLSRGVPPLRSFHLCSVLMTNLMTWTRQSNRRKLLRRCLASLDWMANASENQKRHGIPALEHSKPIRNSQHQGWMVKLLPCLQHCVV